MGDADVLVLGSQSILGTFDEDEFPTEATARAELVPADQRPSRLARIHGFLDLYDGGRERPADGRS